MTLSATTKPMILLYSGGMGSFLAAYTLKKQKREDIELLFTDTKTEDADLYRFLHETADWLGYPLEIISEGRDIWQVFEDTRYMGNTRVDNCSKTLKREMSRKYMASYPPGTEVGTGLHWSEQERHYRAEPLWLPYKLVSPLLDTPEDYQTLKNEALTVSGIKQPLLYDLGLAHNNCGGFCVKAGLGHYKTLLKADRPRYLGFEEKEQKVYQRVPNAKPFLRKTYNGVKHYITLRQFRLWLEEKVPMFEGCPLPKPDDELETGGCMACAL